MLQDPASAPAGAGRDLVKDFAKVGCRLSHLSPRHQSILTGNIN